MTKKRWSDLSPQTRRLIVVAGAADAALRIGALVDLRRRDRAHVRGSKKVWGWAIAVVNSAGVIPVAYFTAGRRPA